MLSGTEIALGAIAGGVTMLVLWGLAGSGPWTAILAGVAFAIVFAVAAHLTNQIKSPYR